jgi:cation transport regulator
MPYQSKKELPASVRKSLPPHAQEIFRETFNNAWKEYRDSQNRKGDSSQEEVAMKVAWSAVKAKYKKEERGKWVKK